MVLKKGFIKNLRWPNFKYKIFHTLVTINITLYIDRISDVSSYIVMFITKISLQFI